MSRLIEALKLTGRRRFALRAVASCRYAGERQRERGTSLVGRCLFGSLSALGLGYSLISGARWQDGGRRQSRRFGDMADGFAV
jgi:hypothetical protein